MSAKVFCLMSFTYPSHKNTCCCMHTYVHMWCIFLLVRMLELVCLKFSACIRVAIERPPWSVADELITAEALSARLPSAAAV